MDISIICNAASITKYENAIDDLLASNQKSSTYLIEPMTLQHPFHYNILVTVQPILRISTSKRRLEQLHVMVKQLSAPVHCAIEELKHLSDRAEEIIADKLILTVQTQPVKD
jgi:hypothetical protein